MRPTGQKDCSVPPSSGDCVPWADPAMPLGQQGRRVDGSTRSSVITNTSRHEPSDRLKKSADGSAAIWGGRAAKQLERGGRGRAPDARASLPFPPPGKYCIGATRPGFPIGSLRSALTGPVADAGRVPYKREWQAMGLPASAGLEGRHLDFGPFLVSSWHRTQRNGGRGGISRAS